MAKKICIISGAARGIGKATLYKYVTEGYTCIAVDRDLDALEQLKAEVSTEKAASIGIWCVDLLHDQTELKDQLVDYVPETEAHLTLVNNVGGSQEKRTPFHDISWESFNSSYVFNLKPVLQLTQACFPVMNRNQNGKIVNIASISARKTLKNVGADYSASKAAVIAVSRHLSCEFAEHGILVNTVCPGIIGTERILHRWQNREEKINHEVLSGIPLHRLGTPEEVAEAVYFLGSEANQYITGAVLDVNGGMYTP
ncbi:UNVERIFIED_CONTAM: 3-oxoacyl-[acyl-carrier protein] reductase [Paenibacillus sp. PvR008]